MLICLMSSASSEKNKCNIFNEKKIPLSYAWYLEMSAFSAAAYFELDRISVYKPSLEVYDGRR